MELRSIYNYDNYPLPWSPNKTFLNKLEDNLSTQLFAEKVVEDILHEYVDNYALSTCKQHWTFLAQTCYVNYDRRTYPNVVFGTLYNNKSDDYQGYLFGYVRDFEESWLKAWKIVNDDTVVMDKYGLRPFSNGPMLLGWILTDNHPIFTIPRYSAFLHGQHENILPISEMNYESISNTLYEKDFYIN